MICSFKCDEVISVYLALLQAALMIHHYRRLKQFPQLTMSCNSSQQTSQNSSSDSPCLALQMSKTAVYEIYGTVKYYVALILDWNKTTNKFHLNMQYQC